MVECVGLRQETLKSLMDLSSDSVNHPGHTHFYSWRVSSWKDGQMTYFRTLDPLMMGECLDVE